MGSVPTGEICTWDGVKGAHELLHIREVQSLVFKIRLCRELHVCVCIQEFSKSVGTNENEGAYPSGCAHCAGSLVIHEKGLFAEFLLLYLNMLLAAFCHLLWRLTWGFSNGASSGDGWG